MNDQLISFECCNCGRQFHLSRTSDFHDSFIISCPLCRTRQPNSVRMPEPEQPEKTRETESDDRVPHKFLEVLLEIHQTLTTVFKGMSTFPVSFIPVDLNKHLVAPNKHLVDITSCLICGQTLGSSDETDHERNCPGLK